MVGTRNDPTSPMYQIHHNWTPDPRDPANFKTIYNASRRIFGDAQWPWNGPVGGGVTLQVKGAGYDDPAVNGNSESMNFVQTPTFDFTARGGDFLADHQGGILTMADGNYSPRHAWGKTFGTLVSGHVYDIIVEVTLSLNQITSRQMAISAGQTGGVRIWIRDWTIDQSDWNDAAHLRANSFTQASSGSGFTPDFIPAVIGPRALGAIEIWNYLGSTGETYPLPSSHPPVAAAAITAGYLPPQQWAGRGIYRGGWVNGERNVHRTYVGPERICTTLAEAQALFGSGTSTPTAPSNTAPPSVAGTRVVGNTLTGSQGSWSGVPTPLLSNQWQFSYDNRAWPLKNEAGALETGLTLALTEQHAGLRVRFAVTGANSSGAPATAYSPWTTIITRSDGNYFGNPGAETA
jgi:hypothetical protein